MITPEELNKLKTKFNLDIEIDYAIHCNKLLGFEGKNVLQIGGSLPEELVFNVLKVGSWTAIEFPERLNSIKGDEIKNHRGAILNRENIIIHEGFGKPLKNRYNVFLTEITGLTEEHYDQYDLIFSVNAFHHVLHFPEALDLMYKSLKENGKLFSLFAPIWSSCNGHNIEELLKDIKIEPGLIPPWGHLVMKASSMFEHLKEKSDAETAGRIVYHIYNNPTLNRYLTEDYLTFIKLSNFSIEKFDALFNQNVPPYSQQMLSQHNPGCKSFGNTGLLIVLNK